jgi:hypothetical protein
LTGSSSVSQRDDSPAFSSQFDGMLGRFPFSSILIPAYSTISRPEKNEAVVLEDGGWLPRMNVA